MADDVDPNATIADKIAIRDMLHRYCRGLDRMDRELVGSVFHPDAQVDYGAAFKGSGVEFIDWVWTQHARATRHSHNITNCYVEVDGDRASSEAYSFMLMRIEAADGVTVVQSNGRYLDQWLRRDGRWAILHRRSVHEFQEIRRLDHDRVPGAATDSARDPADPSYALCPPLFGQTSN